MYVFNVTIGPTFPSRQEARMAVYRNTSRVTRKTVERYGVNNYYKINDEELDVEGWDMRMNSYNDWEEMSKEHVHPDAFCNSVALRSLAPIKER